MNLKNIEVASTEFTLLYLINMYTRLSFWHFFPSIHALIRYYMLIKIQQWSMATYEKINSSSNNLL